MDMCAENLPHSSAQSPAQRIARLTGASRYGHTSTAFDS